MPIKQRIVAEISRNWPTSETPLISKQFEEVIQVNRNRGFELESWRLSQVMVPTDHMIETIVAVFVKG